MSNLLRIIPNENSLKQASPFKEQLSNNLQDVSQPRALRSLAQIIDGGLCHRCGSCVGICPTGVLTTDDRSYPTIKNLAACTDCDLCVKVCPGDEFDFKFHHQQKFGEQGDLTSTHGQFIHSLIAHSNDPYLREHSTSGGLVTEILLAALEKGKIDGAVVIVSDEKEIWKGKPIIARTRDEILKSLKSKYAIAPTNSAFAEIKAVEGKYALVGLPCQIHGFLKAAELDTKLKERVVFTIGIFCHAAVELEGYNIIWNSLGEDKNRAKKFISRVGKHPGTPHLEFEDGSLSPVYYPNKKGFRPSSMEIINILYRLYSPERCLTCFDALAQFADISIGDPWMSPPEDQVDFHDGWSFALVRQPALLEFVNELVAENRITSLSVTKKEALKCNKMMSTEKVWRSFRVIETRRRQGKSVPKYSDYEIKMPNLGFKQFLKTEINMFTHIFCFLPFKVRAVVLRFFLGNGGYSLLWLNSKRRKFRQWSQDKIAMIKRKVFGRM